MTFDEWELVTEVVRFGIDKNDARLAVSAEVPVNTWHTVMALEPSCVLLKVKVRPFDPDQLKDLAPWAPDDVDQILGNI